MKKLSWSEVESVTKQLADKIEKSKFTSDYIIGVTTGGLFPLALLSIYLKPKNILTITAKKVEQDGKEAVTITYLPTVNLKGKTVLLVDEIAQSGTTLNALAQTIKTDCGVKVLKTATLAANKDVCTHWPDYYVLIEEGDWIVFPWEKEEEFSAYNLKH